MLTGEDGILKQARIAVNKTKEAERDEIRGIAILEEMMDGKGTDVEEVKDKNPGVLEVEDGIYVINSIEDLVVFASNVNKGNTYEEKTVKLGLSLDFNASKSYVNPFRTDYGKYGYNGELKKLLTSKDGFIPIGINTNESGYTEKSFKGIFDGNGKIIKNLYINRKVEDNQKDFVIGLFGYNYGTIKNLGVENCNNSGSLTTSGINTCMVGGITGRNYKDIEECFVSGKVSCVCNAKSRCGGICATSDASTIINCYNLATISCTGGNQANVSGGIAGSSAGKLINCFNNGRIHMTCAGNEAECSIGGIVGLASAEGCVVENCYNLNSIEFDLNSDNLSRCGGISGRLGEGLLNNCYNKGKINNLSLNSKPIYIGLILGLAQICTITDCSSLNFNDYQIIGAKDRVVKVDNLASYNDDANMPNILEILGEKFKTGLNGYPILSWQLKNN